MSADVRSLTIRTPDDFHVHLRQGDLLRAVLPWTVGQFRRALVMPNTNPPVRTADDVERYRAEIRAAIHSDGLPVFEPLMSIALTDVTTPEEIRAAYDAGAIAAKLYPRGVTTNSDHGVRDPMTLRPVYAAMADVGMVLCLHGEAVDANVIMAETQFLHVLPRLAADFPVLRMVLEHASTAAAVDVVRTLPRNVAATITVHHLVLTLADVVGARCQPHHFCKPIAKTPDDRAALLHAAMDGNPKFFLGTDSAPHLRIAKESASAPAGVFSAPVALSLLVEIFEEYGAMEQLEDFVSSFGADFYDLPRNPEVITFRRASWLVPEEAGGVVPFRAGMELAWSAHRHWH